MNPPQIPENAIQRQKDEEHLGLLAVFHFVIGGFALLGIGFLAMHYLLMSRVFMNKEMWAHSQGGPPPMEMFQFFIWLYLFLAAVLVVMGSLNVLSGVFMRKRRNRMFSMVVAGIDCIQIPLGTALGVFTLIVLQRPSVREAYDAASAPPR